MAMQKKSQLSKLKAKLGAGKQPRRERLLTLDRDTLIEDLAPWRACSARAGEHFAALDGKTDKGTFERQVLMVNEEALSVSEPSPSLATFQTVSTELYIPPADGKDESLRDGCVSSFKNDLQIAGLPSLPGKKVEDGTPSKANCRKSSEYYRRHKKRRKKSQTELPTADVEAAIRMIVSASEAVVVGQLIDSSNLSSSPDRSIFLEAALSLGKARHLCGLDKYELGTTAMDSDGLAMEDLDDHGMRQAFSDVGLIVDLMEDEHQLLGIGTEVVNLCQEKVDVHGGPCPLESGTLLQTNGKISVQACDQSAQNCKSVEHGPCSSEVKRGQFVADEHKCKVGSHVQNTRIFEESDSAADKEQFQGFGMKYLKECPEDIQFPAGAFSTISCPLESRPLSIDAQIPEKIEDPMQSSRSVVADSLEFVAEKEENVAGHQGFAGGCCQQDTEVLQESATPTYEGTVGGVGAEEVKRCQQDCETPAVVLPTLSGPLERGGLLGLGGKKVANCVIRSAQCSKSAEVLFCTPEGKSEETVAQVHKANQVIKEVLPESDMNCADVLVQLSSMVGRIQQEAVHQQGMSESSVEVDAGETSAIETSGTDNKATQSVFTRDRCSELCLPSESMASKRNGNYPGVGRSSVILSSSRLESATTKSFTPYISRWFGGWPGKAELDPAEDVGKEGNAQRKRSFSIRAPVGKGTLNSQRDSAEAQLRSLPGNGQSASEKDETDAPQFGTPGSLLSSIDPLCSFVPCSILPPAAVSLPPSDRDHEAPVQVAAVESCTHLVMNMAERKKQSDSPPAGLTSELDNAPDPVARTDIGASGQQSIENPRASVSNAIVKGATMKRRRTSMRKFSTAANSISLVLNNIDIAAKSLSKDHFLDRDEFEWPSTSSANHISRSPLLGSNCPEAMPVVMDQSTGCNPETTTFVRDVNLKGALKQKRMATNTWMCADLSDSPPLLWPRRTKRRLTACRVIDSDSIEMLPDDISVTAAAFPADEHHMVQEKSSGMEHHKIQNVSQQSVKRILRISTQKKLRQDSKALFKGLHFLLTGFSAQKKEKISKSIEEHGGDLLADIPPFSFKQRLKKRGVDYGARSPPIVISPQQVRTSKFLYGCAVGSPLLNVSWISASISAVNCLPYLEYQHKQETTDHLLHTDNGGESKNSDGPLFTGLHFHFHGRPDFIAQLSTLAKHAGGKVIAKLVSKERTLKQGHKLVGLVVVEGSSNMPLDLQRVASRLKLHVVDAEWMVLSLLSGKLLPFPTKATPLTCASATQQSSSPQLQELRRCSRPQNRLCENLANTGDTDSGIQLFVKKLKNCSLPDENGANHSNVGPKLRGREEQGHVEIWLGKGFSSPPGVPQLADGIMSPYSHLLAPKKLPKKFLHYEAFLCNGVEYFLGDNVEVRPSSAGFEPSVARIEGLWCEEGRLPQTRAFPQGVRKMASKNVILKCRRFYRPSETGFPGRRTNELYLSNNIDNNVSASDIVKRVRVTLGIADEVVRCSNWYEDQQTALVCQRGILKAADYMCHFFYDHERESLHRIKLKE